METRGAGLFEARLPASQTRAIWTLALFVAIQVADATMTIAGVSRFGLGIEANPLIFRTAAMFGPGVTLIAAKSIAIGCGLILYRHARYLALAILVLGYVFAAIVPWAWLFSA